MTYECLIFDFYDILVINVTCNVNKYNFKYKKTNNQNKKKKKKKKKKKLNPYSFQMIYKFDFWVCFDFTFLIISLST